MYNIECDYERNGASFVTENAKIPEENIHLDLVGKALCRKHHNKLIVNTRKRQKIAKKQECGHPKHKEYSVSSSKDTKLDKAPIRLIEFFKLPSDTLFCNHCKYSSDHDETFQNYPHPASRPKVTQEDELIKFHNNTYALRSDILYTEDQYKELEKAYQEICEELKEAKLGNIF
jgi:hypothetical protein